MSRGQGTPGDETEALRVPESHLVMVVIRGCTAATTATEAETAPPDLQLSNHPLGVLVLAATSLSLHRGLALAKSEWLAVLWVGVGARCAQDPNNCACS